MMTFKNAFLCSPLFLILLFISQNARAQNSNNEDFLKFLSGIRYAYIEVDAALQADIDQGQPSPLFSTFIDYLHTIGITNVAITSLEKRLLLDTVPSLCDIAWVQLALQLTDDNHLTRHQFTFKACNGKVFPFNAQDKVANDEAVFNNLKDVWLNMFGNYVKYFPKNKLEIPVKSTNWRTQSLKERLNSSRIDQLEGIYEKQISPQDVSKYEIAIVKNTEGNYDVIYLKGARNYLDWQEGEWMGTITTTATTNYYTAEWAKNDKTILHNVYVSQDSDNMVYVSFAEDSLFYKHNYLKLYPIDNKIYEPPMATGSGVAISQNGYIVTNYHVVEGGKRLEVHIDQDGVMRHYKANLVASDQENDIALLKVDDYQFEDLPPLPFSLSNQTAEVGEEVFTLGYPLAASMGTEVKLSTGVISALTGYKGNVSNYQSTILVEPGNSGGPLFDSEGNLVGIVKAKHAQATGATYVVKARNIINLIEPLGDKMILPSNKSLEDKNLKEKVRALKKYVFFINIYG